MLAAIHRDPHMLRIARIGGVRTIAKCDLNKRKLFQIWKKKNTFL